MFRFTSIYVNMHSKLIHWGNWWNWRVWLHMEKFKGVSCAWQTLVDREANKYVGSYTSVIADKSPVISICCMLLPVVVTTEWGIWICGWILFVSFVRYGRTQQQQHLSTFWAFLIILFWKTLRIKVKCLMIMLSVLLSATCQKTTTGKQEKISERFMTTFP